jgi:hypothetical protein
LESTESDQPVTCPQVKNDISILNVCGIEQAVPERDKEGGKQLTTELRVSGVTMPDDPLAPGVAVRVIHHSEHRTHDVPVPLPR